MKIIVAILIVMLVLGLLEEFYTWAREGNDHDDGGEVS